MALKKKGDFESYTREREKPKTNDFKSSSDKYSHYRVFDEPESLKRALVNQDTLPEDQQGKAEILDQGIALAREQSVSKALAENLGQDKIKTLDLSPVQNEIEKEDPNSETVSNGFKRIQTVSENEKDSHSTVQDNEDLNGFKSIQTVSGQTVSNGFKGFQTASHETVSNGFKGMQTVSETVSKPPSKSELMVLYYFQEISIQKNEIVIQRSAFAKTIGLKLAGVKTALTRLKNKGFIELINSFRGRYTGNTSYKLTPKAYEILANPEMLKTLGFKRFQTVSQTVSNSLINSSSLNINKTITSLPADWKKINITPLESIGFAEKHLLDIYEANQCEANVVQTSIDHFAFGLEKGKYNYDDPVRVFIGRLRKGTAWFESDYESPKIKAARELVEMKKAEKEKLDAMINEAIELEFPNWRKKLTEEEIKQIVPESTLKPGIPAAITADLRIHFRKKILLPRLGIEEEI